MANTQAAKAQNWISIPAGSRPVPCRGTGCNVPIYFVHNPRTGRMVPVDASVEGAKKPSEAKVVTGQLDAFGAAEEVYPGRGQSHFLSCSAAAEFTRGVNR